MQLSPPSVCDFVNVIAWDMEGSRQLLSTSVWAHEGCGACRDGETRRWCLEATGHFPGLGLQGGEARWDLSVDTGHDQVHGVPREGEACHWVGGHEEGPQGSSGGWRRDWV